MTVSILRNDIEMIKDIFKAFYAKHKTELDKNGIKLSGIEEPVKYEVESTLEDGTKIVSTSSEFEVGAPVFVIDAEGNAVPAPDGEHTLADGTKILVASGTIESVTEVTPEEEMSKEEIEANLAAMGEALSKATTENETLKARIAELEGTQSELAKAKAEIAQLKKQPAATSVTQEKAGAKKSEEPKPEKSWHQMTYVERIRFNRQKQAN